MRIEVTTEDIQQGIRNNCHLCPVARAIGRAYGIEHGKNGAISVRPGGISFWRGSQGGLESFYFETPLKVQGFIAGYDYEGEVQPFTFELPGTLTEWACSKPSHAGRGCRFVREMGGFAYMDCGYTGVPKQVENSPMIMGQGESMATSDALEILNRRIGNNAEIRAMVAEEQAKIAAAASVELLHDGDGICSQCAETNGAQMDADYICTLWTGYCLWCKQIKSVCAVRDWVWKKQPEIPQPENRQEVD